MTDDFGDRAGSGDEREQTDTVVAYGLGIGLGLLIAGLFGIGIGIGFAPGAVVGAAVGIMATYLYRRWFVASDDGSGADTDEQGMMDA